MSTKRLIVLVPGMTCGLKPYNALLARLRAHAEEEQGHTHWLLAGQGSLLLSSRRATDLALNLSARIDAAWNQQGGFDEVLLLAHSAGGVLARMAYLIASGACGDGMSALPWSGRVTRIVLMASINRGVGADESCDERPYQRLYRLLAFSFRVVPFLRRLLLHDLLRGSAFLTNLRISWIRHFAQLDAPPHVVQLLGADDGLVTRADSLDIEQLHVGWHIVVPDSDHRTIHRVSDPGLGPARYACIHRALFGDHPGAASDNITPRAGPKRVIFLLHGIRSSVVAWSDPLAKLLERQFADSADTVVLPATYGYFRAWQFALPATRTRHLAWFADQYAQQLALNPEAEFLFLGHSNGTYVFAENLKRLPAMRFKRAVFVGSVLPKEYDWSARVARGQLASFCNLRSSRDFPVAVLCSALRGLGMRDVGTAGFEGFLYVDPRVKEEIYWFDGGHSAPLTPEHLPHLVRHLLADPTDPARSPPCDPRGCRIVSNASRLYGLLSRWAPGLAWFAIGAVAIGLFHACQVGYAERALKAIALLVGRYLGAAAS